MSDKGKQPETSAAATTSTTKEEAKKIEMKAKDCPIATVTVYSDRAEVVRNVAFDIASAGPLEVIVDGLSTRIDANSVHVSGGQGNAVILEVTTKTNYSPDAEVSEAIKRKGEQKEALEEELKELNVQLSSVTAASSWLQGLAENVKV